MVMSPTRLDSLQTMAPLDTDRLDDTDVEEDIVAVSVALQTRITEGQIGATSHIKSSNLLRILLTIQYTKSYTKHN